MTFDSFNAFTITVTPQSISWKYTIGNPKVFVSNQKVESIIIQRVERMKANPHTSSQLADIVTELADIDRACLFGLNIQLFFQILVYHEWGKVSMIR